jgi:hypothetical protein
VRSALIAFLVATCTASAAVPTPLGDSPSMQQYNRLKQRVAAIYACMGTGVPVVVVTAADGREYLSIPNDQTTARVTYLVANGCTS